MNGCMFTAAATEEDDRSTSGSIFLIRRLILRDSSRGVFAVTGFAGNVFRFSFTSNLVIELIDDVLQLLSATQRVFFVGFRHIASIDFRSLAGGPRSV
jgi:hypothetical protein